MDCIMLATLRWIHDLQHYLLRQVEKCRSHASSSGKNCEALGTGAFSPSQADQTADAHGHLQPSCNGTDASPHMRSPQTSHHRATFLDTRCFCPIVSPSLHSFPHWLSHPYRKLLPHGAPLVGPIRVPQKPDLSPFPGGCLTPVAVRMVYLPIFYEVRIPAI